MRKRTSKYIGVYKYRNKWVARITKDKKQQYIGIFEDEKDAARAYNLRAIYIYKDEAVLNENIYT